MNLYEYEQEQKRARYIELAQKAEQRALAAAKQASKLIEKIPPGQPIIYGHYSEQKHRSDLTRYDRLMRRSIEESKKAKNYREKANSIGKGGISSDDPEAIEKLRAQLEKLEAKHQKMKEINRIIRMSISEEEKIEKIKQEYDIPEPLIKKLIHPELS